MYMWKWTKSWAFSFPGLTEKNHVPPEKGWHVSMERPVEKWMWVHVFVGAHVGTMGMGRYGEDHDTHHGWQTPTWSQNSNTIPQRPAMVPSLSSQSKKKKEKKSSSANWEKLKGQLCVLSILWKKWAHVPICKTLNHIMTEFNSKLERYMKLQFPESISPKE